jgi:enoyl-CoA hydratase/carnithine racemase
LINDMMRQDDYREGVAAFLEKRSPTWGRNDEGGDPGG